MRPTDVFRLFLHVRERTGAQNEGLRVEAIQRWGGGRKGDAWCCWLATLVLDLVFQGKSPIPRLGSCDDVLKLAKDKGWLSDKPHVDDLFLFLRDPDGPQGPRGMEDAYHVGMVTEVLTDSFVGIAGNTSEDGKSHNGVGVFEHMLPLTPGKVVFVRYPR